MSDNKKYYYLKLKENFYESEEMIILQSMPDGYLYSDILLKLYLRSLKSDGRLMFKGIIPYTPTVLAQVVRHQIGTVEKALKIFKQLNLVEILDNGAIYMCDIQNFIGMSSNEADRQRLYYNKIKSEKTSLQADLQKSCKKSYMISTPEIEIEKELKIEIEKNIPSKDTCVQIKKSQKEIENGFNELWEQYPKKQGRAQAKKNYEKAIRSGVKHDEIKNGLMNFISYVKLKNIDYQYIPQGSTWFNQKRWEDDYKTLGYERNETDDVFTLIARKEGHII